VLGPGGEKREENTLEAAIGERARREGLRSAFSDARIELKGLKAVVFGLPEKEPTGV